jgi:hypothetical protein
VQRVQRVQRVQSAQACSLSRAPPRRAVGMASGRRLAMQPTWANIQFNSIRSPPAHAPSMPPSPSTHGPFTRASTAAWRGQGGPRVRALVLRKRARRGVLVSHIFPYTP